MAVEHGQGPDRQHQAAGHGEEDADAGHREVEAVHRQRAGRHLDGVAAEARGEEQDDGPRQQVAEQGDAGRHGQHQAEDGARETAGLLLPALGQQAAVDGDEGGREDTLPQQVLEDVGHPHGRRQGVLVGADAEAAGEGPLAHEAHQPAEQDAGEDHRGTAFRAGRGRRRRRRRLVRRLAQVVLGLAHFGRSFQLSSTFQTKRKSAMFR